LRIHERRRVFLLSGVLICGAAISLAQTESTPGSGNPGQAIPGTSGVSPFAGSVPAKLVPGVMPLSLQDAIIRGLKQNLGLLLSRADIRSARGQRWEQLSALLPHVTAAPDVEASKINLSELGLTSFGGITLPRSVGAFSYFDARAAVAQTLFDWKSINATRAAGQSLKSAAYTFKDARDLVVLAVGYVYLQAIADEARIDTAEAQVKTAQALYDQASDQINAGTSPDIDGLRTKVELQTRQQQLIQAKNNFAIQKLTVARVIGLAPGQEFEFTDKSPYQPLENMTVDEALKRAYALRSDYQAAMTDVPAISRRFPLTQTMGWPGRIPPRQRQLLTYAEHFRFRSFRAEAFTAMLCRLMRDSSRAASASTVCERKSTPMCERHC
jgi:outer membrane protein TolC